MMLSISATSLGKAHMRGIPLCCTTISYNTISRSQTFSQRVIYPKNGVRYELHDRVIVEIQAPTGDHEKVIAFLSRKLTVQFDRLNLAYGIPKTTFVKTPGAESTYSPDILLLNLDTRESATTNLSFIYKSFTEHDIRAMGAHIRMPWASHSNLTLRFRN